MSSDRAQVNNMFSSSDWAYDPTKNNEKQWIHQNDNNQGNYDAGITFEIPNISTKLVPINEAHLTGVVQVTNGAGTSFTGAERFSLPFGLMGFFYGASVKTSTGDQLINNTDIVTRNYARWLNGQPEANESSNRNLYIRKADELIPPNMFSTSVQTLTDSQYLSALDFPRNYVKNAKEILNTAYFQTVNGVGTWYIPFDIPLSYIDPFFANLDFLLTNVGLSFIFITAFSGVGKRQNYITFAPGTGTTPTDLTAFISPSSGGISSLGTTCRIYYPYVIPNATEYIKINALLDQGWSKEVEYLVPSYKKYSMTVDGSSPQAHTITTSCVLPQKLHIFAVPKNTWTQINTPYVAPSGNLIGTMGTGCFAGGGVGVPINNVQIAINGVQYFTNTPQNWVEKWQYTKENIIDRGENGLINPQLSVYDFRSTYCGYMSFDISRLQDRIQNPYAAVSIDLTLNFFDSAVRTMAQTYNAYGLSAIGTGILPTTMDVDLYVVIEASMKVRFDVTRKEVKAVLGLNPSS